VDVEEAPAGTPNGAEPEILEEPVSLESSSPATEEAPLAAEVGPEPDAPSGAPPDVLEELTFPPLVESIPPLAADTVVGPDGRLTIVRLLEAHGRVNRYEARWREGEQSIPVEAREAPLDHLNLRREAEVLAGTRFTMLPTCLAAFEYEQLRYLVIEPCGGQSLETALAQHMQPAQALSVVVQLAQALRRLHQDGWAYVALGPADIVLSQPLKIVEINLKK